MEYVWWGSALLFVVLVSGVPSRKGWFYVHLARGFDTALLHDYRTGGCGYGSDGGGRCVVVHVRDLVRRGLVSPLYLSCLYYWMVDGVGNSNGVLQPYSQLGCWKWMYRLSPYTYVVEMLLGNGE